MARFTKVVYVTPEMHARVKALAREIGMTISETAEMLLRIGFEKMAERGK